LVIQKDSFCNNEQTGSIIRAKEIQKFMSKKYFDNLHALNRILK